MWSGKLPTQVMGNSRKPVSPTGRQAEMKAETQDLGVSGEALGGKKQDQVVRAQRGKGWTLGNKNGQLGLATGKQP